MVGLRNSTGSSALWQEGHLRCELGAEFVAARMTVAADESRYPNARTGPREMCATSRARYFQRTVFLRMYICPVAVITRCQKSQQSRRTKKHTAGKPRRRKNTMLL